MGYKNIIRYQNRNLWAHILFFCYSPVFDAILITVETDWCNGWKFNARCVMDASRAGPGRRVRNDGVRDRRAGREGRNFCVTKRFGPHMQLCSPTLTYVARVGSRPVVRIRECDVSRSHRTRAPSLKTDRKILRKPIAFFFPVILHHGNI